MNTYILEYRFKDVEFAHDWVEVDTFEDGQDARMAYWDHIKEFKHADCRVREVKTVSHVEERTVAEYSLGEF